MSELPTVDDAKFQQGQENLIFLHDKNFQTNVATFLNWIENNTLSILHDKEISTPLVDTLITLGADISDSLIKAIEDVSSHHPTHIVVVVVVVAPNDTFFRDGVEYI